MTPGELQKLRDEAIAKAKAILDKAESDNENRGRDLTSEEAAEHDTLLKEVESLNERMKRSMKTSAWVDSNRQSTPEPITAPAPEVREFATPKRNYRLTSFKDNESAFRFAQFMLAVNGNEASQRWMKNKGMELRIHKEGVATTGGYLVPIQVDNDLVSLVEQYGVARQRCRIVPMTSDTAQRPRRTGGLTPYLVGESSAGTESTMSFDQLVLTARKWMILTLMSSELNEDSAIPMADILAREIALGFAKKEDDCLFAGDGTSTYGGIVGIPASFTNLTATIGDIAGLYVGTGNLFSEFILADFAGTMGLLPMYAYTPNTAWYCSSVVWGHMKRLEVAGGGNTLSDLQSGPNGNMSFLGYPVVISQSLPRVDGNSQVAALFGDLQQAVDFGDRRASTIAFDYSATVGSVSAFANDCIAVKATERFDINVHDYGNSSATAASRVQGPVVGLISAAS